MAKLIITNSDARRLFLHKHALGKRSSGPLPQQDVLSLVRELGFVQLDSINTVERAHHVIMFSRASGYERESLSGLHHQGALFEHLTHDASLLPIEFYPHWHHRFRNARTPFSHARWQEFETDPKKLLAHVRRRIRKEGALATRAFEDERKGPWWGWGPKKTALEYLFRTGELAIARRDRFEKVYDLAERVIPAELRSARPTRRQTVDWSCREALTRLGFGTAREIAGFFDLVEIAEARDWTKAALRKKEIVELTLTAKDGSTHTAFALPSLEAEIVSLEPAHAPARFLSPFDPSIRDRKRTSRLFGFDYTIEVFVPEKKRRYGYYVMPILEGERFIGRADLKTLRAENRIEVKGLWPEPNVVFDRHRKDAIDAAVAELSRFACQARIAE
ncbi:MAG TPA: crosslink repair DNA glycosylase YcaQ family protein [Rhizomicrobium sp.]|nr:crosslink repair DNA glycosylase YcaQ family protein [Rhizomicrobium sp.]